ncbi:MAG TPA: T9SS type A sorting domain-containing protein, partial [Bacteroidia bacterium]|nr:T9SS type A sorting domain-containing protein [Bacteroidia bacterium]
NNNLYVGGVFDSAGGQPAKNIAKWNGTTWSAIGSITSKIDPYRYQYNVYTMAVYKAGLYVGGQFDTVNNKPINAIAMWNDTIWSTVGSGSSDTAVLALTVYNNELYAGGFIAYGTSYTHPSIDKWNGVSWSSVASWKNDKSPNQFVGALFVFDSVLCVGGQFDSIAGVKANDVAYWNGSGWGTFGSGIPDNRFSSVYCFGEYNSVLYAGGWFDTAGAIRANCIAQWKGPLGINELSENNDLVNVYPNPSNGIFNLEIKKGEAFTSSNYGSVTSNYESGITNKVEVYNMLGEIVYVQTLRQAQGGNKIDISNQPSGIYLYRIVNKYGSPIKNGKLIIVR